MPRNSYFVERAHWGQWCVYPITVREIAESIELKPDGDYEHVKAWPRPLGAGNGPNGGLFDTLREAFLAVEKESNG